MNWDDLRIFLAVSRFGRNDLAARHLGLDASTVGRRVTRLEKAVGATLFEQSRGGQLPTESGRRLLEHAESMEHCAINAAGEAIGEIGALTGYIRISVSEAFGTWILARHLPEFMQRHPAVTVDLVASGGFLSPSKREADIAIMLARPARGPLLARRLCDYRLGLYASDDYLTRAGTPATIEALGAHMLVGFVPDLIQVPQQRLYDEIPGNLVPSIRSTSINAQAALVSAGAGIGILPRFVGETIAGASPVLPEMVQLKRTFWLVVHKDVRKLARVDVFLNWLIDVFRKELSLIAG